ncbi:hypothetical protein BCV71DRAFT_276937, partial [Rhizopus microsporus]
EDEHRNVVDENVVLSSWNTLSVRMSLLVKTIAIRTDYLKNATFAESSLTYAMLVENSKDENIHMKGNKAKKRSCSLCSPG